MIRFLEFQIGDAALVNAGIERGGDALHDRGLVFPEGVGRARPTRAGARGRASGAEVSGGPGGGRGLRAVQTFVGGANEAGAVLDAVHGALQCRGQSAFRLFEDEVGERLVSAVLRQLVGAATDVGGERAGVVGRLEGRSARSCGS